LLAARDPDASVRVAADSALAKLTADATKAIVRALGDTSVAVRRAAARVLGQLYEGSKKAVPALVTATTDSDDSVRTLAVVSLGQLGPSAYSAVGVVRRLATSAGPQRAAALMALPNIDTESRSLYDVYFAALTDTSASVRVAAAWMLPLAIGEAQVEPAPLLARAADDTVPAVRAAAVRALALLSEHDTAAMTAMKAIGARGDSSLRRLVDSALAAGPHPAQPRRRF
jgi:HEAT repeat protein